MTIHPLLNRLEDGEPYFTEMNRVFDESGYDIGPWRGDIAQAFQQYRPPIPEIVAECLVRELSLKPDDIVVDLGCGTGHFSRLLARQGLQVIGADINRDMLAQALAAQDNAIRYVLAGSKELRTLPYRVGAVSICRAFFSMDKARTLTDLDPIVAAGGGIALIEEPNFFERHEPWQRLMGDLLAKWIPGIKEYHAPTMKTEDALAASPFSSWREIWLTENYRWTVDQALKIVYSTSLSPARFLNEEQIQLFEAECRDRLLALYPAGWFFETRRFQIILASRPSDPK